MCSYNIDLFVAYMYAMKHVDVSCMDLKWRDRRNQITPPPFFFLNSTAY